MLRLLLLLACWCSFSFVFAGHVDGVEIIGVEKVEDYFFTYIQSKSKISPHTFVYWKAKQGFHSLPVKEIDLSKRLIKCIDGKILFAPNEPNMAIFRQYFIELQKFSEINSTDKKALEFPESFTSLLNAKLEEHSKY